MKLNRGDIVISNNGDGLEVEVYSYYGNMFSGVVVNAGESKDWRKGDESITWFTSCFEIKERVEGESVLEIQSVPVFDKYVFRISYQDEEILKRGEFRDDEIDVISADHPEYCGDTLFIRGDEHDKDNRVTIVTNEELESIISKVDAINKKYGKKKRWRANKNEKYYYINSIEVIKTEECGLSMDNHCYSRGNYFKTKEEAEKYSNRIKEMLLNRVEA